jgi:hypothetical protein
LSSSSRGSFVISSHLSCGLPTGCLPWYFPCSTFCYSSIIHSDSVTSPL